jgi:hypothetical protein
MYATTGLYFVVGHSKDGHALLLHAAPTAKEALGGTYREALSLATVGKKTRAIGVALTQAMRELEHIERTVGLDRGLPLQLPTTTLPYDQIPQASKTPTFGSYSRTKALTSLAWTAEL